MLHCGDFIKFDVLTNQKCSRDNRKDRCSLRLALSFLSGPLLNSL